MKINNRLLEISEDHQQITLKDSRYYKRNGEYYPSVTTILQYYPKGTIFEDWLRKVGYASEYIVKQAAAEGTQVHNMIEQYLKGEELIFINSFGQFNYEPDIWMMFLKFVDFWETYKPKLLETEIHLFSDELKVAGTCDLIIEMNDQRWLLDIKTSNHLQTIYELQTAIYTQCYKECFGLDIHRQGILWLKSAKRGPSKKAIQGKGWEIFESERTQEQNLNIFKNVKSIFDLENPEHAPKFTEFRAIVKREM